MVTSIEKLTGTVGKTVRDDLVGGGLVATGLTGAVTDTVAEVLVGAVARDITLGATEGRGCNANHVLDTGLLACC